MQVSIEQAYAEACQALGEEIVKSRLFGKALGEAEQLLQSREEARKEEAKGVANADGDDKQGGHKANGRIPEPTP